MKFSLSNLDKKNLIKNFLFILSVTVIYSLLVNIPLIEMNYPKQYFLLAFFMSIARSYIIWFIVFLNRWVFAIFTIFTFIAGNGLKYVNEYLSMNLNIGTFEVIFSTNLAESKGVMNSTLISYFIIGAVIGLIIVFMRFKFITNKPYKSINGGGFYS